MNDLTLRPLDHPHCNVCNAPVEFMDVEWHTKKIHSYMGPTEVVHTGMVTVTIRCHGEEWRQTMRMSEDSP